MNASPDIRQQIAQTPDLQPVENAPLRSTPIAAVVLTNADVDHVLGLLSLRERQAFNLYGSRRVLHTLEDNNIFRVLDPQFVKRIELPLDQATPIEGPNGSTGIVVATFAVPGKVALFLETGATDADFNADPGDTVGVSIVADGQDARVAYVPGCAAIDEKLSARLAGTDLLLFDGTVFRDDDMMRAGVGAKSGQRMGHLAMSGDNGSIRLLEGVAIGRRVFVHINNTNPVLHESSPERAEVETAGWEIARDGMEFML